MNEFGQSFEHESHAEPASILSDAEKTTIERLVEHRSVQSKFKLEISRHTFVKEDIAQLDKETEGALPFSDEARKKLTTQRETFITKAKQFGSVAPNLSASIYADLAKLDLSSGQSFQDMLQKAQDAINLAQDLPKKSPKDFLPQAVTIGILKKSLERISMPSIETMAQAVRNDVSLLPSIALILNEHDRSAFLGLLPEGSQKEASAIMDHALSRVLHPPVASSKEQEQITAVQLRVKTELENILQPTDQPSRSLVKLLADTLAQLGDEESKKIIQDITLTSLNKSDASKEKGTTAIAARLIRELSKIDNVSGGNLAMTLLGSRELNPHYFTYFRDYLYQNGFLTQHLDQAGNKFTEDQCKGLYEFLKSRDAAWQDEPNVNRQFEEAVKIFGWKKMLTYAGRSDITPHDALFAFGAINKLQKESRLSANQFYGNVLQQVSADSSLYESGTAYHEFNQIAQSLDVSERKLAATKQQVDRYPNINKLRDLGAYFSDPKQIVSSWTSLKKYTDLIRLLEQAEILEQLQELKQEATSDLSKAKLYNFVEMLAFHRDSKVDMNAVIEFWHNASEFFARGDPQMVSGKLKELHDAIKPSNYEDIRYLDLSAEELRDALVDGSLDRLQTFRPMEIIYSAGQAGKEDIKVELTFHEQVRREVGSRAEGTANPSLFYEVNKILRQEGISATDYLLGKSALLDELPASRQQVVREQLSEAMAQYPNPKKTDVFQKTAGRYRARVNYKSDPQAVLAGNDTSCCMPFGSGKNTNYMINPTCGLFTLEEQRGNRWRTVAQSVVTMDYNIGKKVSELTQAETDNLIELLPDAVLQNQKRILACDNIELAPNSQGKADLVKLLYGDFFKKYIEYYNDQAQSDAQLDNSRIVIGQGNSDIRFGSQEDNTYLPVSLIGYSDKFGQKVDVIRFQSSQQPGQRLIAESVTKSTESLPEPLAVSDSGILPLGGRDVLAAAVIESKAYPQNMREGLTQIQNYIFASEINNQTKERPNLSLRYVDNTGAMRGYLTAYEGVREDEPVIYIEDLAADPKSRIAGGRLINGFLENYRSQYIEQGELTPVFLQAREGTSYEIIRNNLDRISRNIGISFDTQEVQNYQFGDSRMRALLLTPRAS